MNQAPPYFLRLSAESFDILVCSTKGYTHTQKGIDCQDSCFASQTYFKGYPYTLIAVSDGHGAPKHYRSAQGSLMALNAIQQSTNMFVKTWIELINNKPIDWIREAQNDYTNHLSKELLRKWKYSVKADTLQNNDYKVTLADNIEKYGTTLAVVTIFNNYVFIGSIGDSQIYSVQKQPFSNNRTVTEEYFYNFNTIGPETYSLCNDNHNYWQSKVFSSDDIKMIIVTSDGMPNSFPQPAKKIDAILDQYYTEGIESLGQKLAIEIKEWSYYGSGDDISMVLLFSKK